MASFPSYNYNYVLSRFKARRHLFPTLFLPVLEKAAHQRPFILPRLISLYVVAIIYQMDHEEYRRKFEKEIRRLMEDRLTSGTMNANRASEIADYILSTLHPHITFNQINELSTHFDEHFSELVPIVHEIQRDYDNRIKEAVTHHVSKLLKDNKITEAHISY